MRYYTIQNNEILIAENRQTLERFYDNVLPLPKDYKAGKYIAYKTQIEQAQTVDVVNNINLDYTL